MKELVNKLSTAVEALKIDVIDLLRVLKMHNDVLTTFKERIQALEDKNDTD